MADILTVKYQFMANAAAFGGFLLYLAEAFKQIRDGATAAAFTMVGVM